MSIKWQHPITLKNKHLGTRIINNEVELIADNLRILEFYRKNDPTPSQELLEDIEAYKIMLSTKDPATTIKKYLTEKDQMPREMIFQPRHFIRKYKAKLQ